MENKIIIDGSEYVSIKYFAEVCEVTERTVRNWIEKGRFIKGKKERLALEVKPVGRTKYIKYAITDKRKTD